MDYNQDKVDEITIALLWLTTFSRPLTIKPNSTADLNAPCSWLIGYARGILCPDGTLARDSVPG